MEKTKYAGRAIFFRPGVVVALVLLFANTVLLMSILGLDVSLAGRRVLMLSGITYPLDDNTIADGPAVEHINSDVPSGEYRTVRMRVTAYCPCRKCCGRFADGVTACNYKIRPGDVFAAADKEYRFGTELIVPGYNKEKPVKVMDRGRLIKGNRLDVFFASHRQAKAWGTKILDVKISD